MPRVKSVSSQLRDAIRSEGVSGIVHDGREGASLEEVGGKAKGLLRLKSAEKEMTSSTDLNFSVPPFFIVSPQVDLNSKLGSITKMARIMDVEQFAVRSSHPLEDVGENHTFDGIFETKLNVPLAQIGSAIEYVRHSAITDRSVRYASERGIELEDRMPVIVQAMVADSSYTGVVYSKFPSPYDVAKVTMKSMDGIEDMDVFKRETDVGETAGWVSRWIFSSFSYGERYGVLQVSKTGEYINDIMDNVMRLEVRFGYPIMVEFALVLPTYFTSTSDGTQTNNSNAAFLQARRITRLSGSEHFRMPQLEEKGLVAQTRFVNGAGDVAAQAYVVELGRMQGYTSEVSGISDEEFRRAERFNAEHPEGYIIFAPFLDSSYRLTDTLDELTSNKKAVVAYMALGDHHDIELARTKGILYLGFGNGNNTMVSAIQGWAGLEKLQTGDKVRVVSDGVQGFVYKEPATQP